MSKKKKKETKDNTTHPLIALIKLIGLVASVPIAATVIIQGYFEIDLLKKNYNEKSIIYTAVEIVGKVQLPKDALEPNKLKAKVTITNNGTTTVQFDSSLMIYVINNKTGHQSDLSAKLVQVSIPDTIISRNPMLLEPNKSMVYETSFYNFDNWYSTHNQYVVHLFSRDNDYISVTKKVNYNKAEDLWKMYTIMDGIMKHHFGKLSIPKTQAEEIKKVATI